MTEQFLAVHNIAYVDNEPQIEKLEVNDEEAIVYFNVEGELFYFAVYVSLKPDISVR